MAKFYGPIGYVVTVEKDGSPDVFVEKPIEKFYKGDLNRNRRKMNNEAKINDDISIVNEVSIVADPYALSHIFAMRYVKWMGVYWKVTDVDVQSPRLILTLGGQYHGETAD